MAGLRAQRNALRQQGWDLKRLHTALSWLEDFVEHTNSRPSGRGHTEAPPPPRPAFYGLTVDSWEERRKASRHDQETLELLAVFMQAAGSRVSLGKPLLPDTIATVLTTLRVFRARDTGREVLAPGEVSTTAQLIKEFRRDAGLASVRAESRGMRAWVLRRAWDAGYAKTHPREWELALVAHNLVLRGGEPGGTGDKAWQASKGISMTDVEWHTPNDASRGYEWLTIDVVSIKDQLTTLPRAVPMPIRERTRTNDGNLDAMCTFGFITDRMRQLRKTVSACGGDCVWCWGPAAARRAIGGRVPMSCRRANTPLLQQSDGSPWNTKRVGEVAAEIALAAGLSKKEVAMFGAKSFRIGGATDLHEIYGAAGERLLRERGRWKSDIAYIYARAITMSHLEASAAVGDANAMTLEDSLSGWTQPAGLR